MARQTLRTWAETWPIAGEFVISRGAKRVAHVVVAAVTDGAHEGRGECVPYARYGETVDSVIAQIEAVRDAVAAGAGCAGLAAAMPPGAARNAVDCALWDVAAKASGQSAAAIAGLEPLKPVLTAYTISLDTPQAMAEKARNAGRFPLLKLKLGGEGDAERLAAVREALPDARLIVDANEAWTGKTVEPLLAACAAARVEVVEQPLPAAEDALLTAIARPVPICADESLHSRAGLNVIATRYDAVNIKLDKAGGLTEALALAAGARARGLKIMAGCMVATSLAMAPAMLIAQTADWVDLDGPLLLARDRESGLTYSAGLIAPPPSALWG